MSKPPNTAGDGWETHPCPIGKARGAPPHDMRSRKAGHGRFICDTCGIDATREEWWKLESEGTPPARPRASRPQRERSDGAVCLADVEPEEVRFLWHPRIPLGKLTIVEGDPGQGKSFLTAALAAAISRGSGLPGMGHFEPGRVLFFTAEDGLGDTLRPRLDAMGADVTRVFAYAEPFDVGTESGLERVRGEMEKHRPALVIFDPITAYVGAATDTHRANQVRAVLAPLARLAESEGCAVLVVRHLAKRSGGKAIYRGLGSIDFTAAARSVLLVGSPPSEPGSKVLLHIKCNVAEHAPALGYRLTGGAFEWTGESTLTAGDILAEEIASGQAGKIEEAREFLREVLSHGPVEVQELKAMAKKEGHAWRTVEEAKRREGVRSSREGFGKGSSCRWHLPEPAGEEDDTDPHRPQGNPIDRKGTDLAEYAAYGDRSHGQGWEDV